MTTPIATLKSLFPCLPFALSPKEGSIQLPSSTIHHSLYHDEKTPLHPDELHIEKSASDIVTAMLNAHKTGPSLDNHIASLVHQAGGWSEYLAHKILSALESALKLGKKMSPAMQVAYERACEEAKAIEGFAAEHPVATAVFCTVVALGVLVEVVPYVLGVLGFAELGPVEGSFAARWMAMYGGFMPEGSLYSYLQQLKMI